MGVCVSGQPNTQQKQRTSKPNGKKRRFSGGNQNFYEFQIQNKKECQENVSTKVDQQNKDSLSTGSSNNSNQNNHQKHSQQQNHQKFLLETLILPPILPDGPCRVSIDQMRIHFNQ